MRFAEVIVSEIQTDSSLKVFQLFAECVFEPGKASAMHPQSVVLLFNVRRGNAADVRSTRHNGLFHPHNFRRAISDCGFFAEINNGVGFRNLAIVDFPTAETPFHRVNVSVQGIGSHLDAIVETFSKVRDKRLSVIGVTLAHNKGRNNFAVSIQSDERPDIAVGPASAWQKRSAEAFTLP